MATTTVTIRKAHKRDIVQVVWLLEQLWYKQTVRSLQKTFNLYTNSGQYGILVAESECAGWIVGMVAYFTTHIFVTGRTRFHIEALVVFEGYRRHGIGRKLLEAVEQIAQSCGPCVVDFVAMRARAKHGVTDFCRSMGYQCSLDAAKLYFSKEFRGGGPDN